MGQDRAGLRIGDSRFRQDGQLTRGESGLLLAPIQLVGVALASLCVLKRKPFAAIVGLFVPLVALVGAVRLARPDSRWARRFYGEAKLSKAENRFAAEQPSREHAVDVR